MAGINGVVKKLIYGVVVRVERGENLPGSNGKKQIAPNANKAASL